METLARYNIWANAKAIGWLQQIDDAQWERGIPSSFSSVRQTAIHIASAEKIWVDFWTSKPDPVFLSTTFTGSKDDLIDIWKKASAGMSDFIQECPPDHYWHPIVFHYPRGGEAQMQFAHTVTHIINHSTYHRGQLVTLLRQVGFTGFSSIDLATYYLTVKASPSNFTPSRP